MDHAPSPAGRSGRPLPRLTRRQALGLLGTALGALACGRPATEEPARRPWATSTPSPTAAPSATPTAAPGARPTSAAHASAGPTPAGRSAPDAVSGPPSGRPEAPPDVAPSPAAPPRAGPPPTAGAVDALARVIPVFNPPPLPAVRQLPPQRLVVPRLGIDAKVVELGTKRDRNGELVWETAAFAAGHHRGTANPGEAGNMVISGHISSPHEGDVFRRLPEIAVGDGAIVYTAERVFLYRVVEKHVVPPSEVSVMEPGDRPTLTLITCVPDGVYSHRLVVFAHEV